MADTFNLTAKFDKDTYNVGDTMTVSVTGTVENAPSNISATINIKASDGATSVLTATAALAPGELTWVIDSVTDTAGRTWTVAEDGHSASAIA